MVTSLFQNANDSHQDHVHIYYVATLNILHVATSYYVKS